MSFFREKKRYPLLDFIRGLTLLSMIGYHGMWDLCNIFGVKCNFFDGFIGRLWQRSICMTFILLSGFCFCLGKKHLKRGLVLIGGGGLLTAVTVLLMYENRIVFGILTFMGTSQLIFIFLEKLLKKINCFLGLVLSICLFVVFYNVNFGYIGVGKLTFGLPDFLYSNILGTFFGFKEPDFYSADYFSILPWLFLYATGFYLFYAVGGKKTLEKLPNVSVAPINFIGKHSFVFYMLHQPVVYGVLWMVMSIIQ